jgi:hypothetical protein
VYIAPIVNYGIYTVGGIPTPTALVQTERSFVLNISNQIVRTDPVPQGINPVTHGNYIMMTNCQQPPLNGYSYFMPINHTRNSPTIPVAGNCIFGSAGHYYLPHGLNNNNAGMLIPWIGPDNQDNTPNNGTGGYHFQYSVNYPNSMVFYTYAAHSSYDPNVALPIWGTSPPPLGLTQGTGGLEESISADRENNGVSLSKIEDENSSLKLHIVPNPANDELSFQTIDAETKIKNIKILDISGRLIKEQNTSDQSSFLMNIQSVINGTYLIKVETNHGVTTHLQVIQH